MAGPEAGVTTPIGAAFEQHNSRQLPHPPRSPGSNGEFFVSRVCWPAGYSQQPSDTLAALIRSPGTAAVEAQQSHVHCPRAISGWAISIEANRMMTAVLIGFR